jgi:hypothetical protein
MLRNKMFGRAADSSSLRGDQRDFHLCEGYFHRRSNLCSERQIALEDEPDLKSAVMPRHEASQLSDVCIL